MSNDAEEDLLQKVVRIDAWRHAAREKSSKRRPEILPQRRRIQR